MPSPTREAQSEENDDAVSPVIGVILMVAITVILAAVIGTFVLGLTEDVQPTVQAGVNVQYDPANTQLTATYVSAQTADYVNVTFSNLAGPSAKGNLTNVGDTLILTGGGDAWLNVTGRAYVMPASGPCGNGISLPSSADCDLPTTWSSGDRVSVTATGVKGDQATVILTKDNQI